MYICIYIWPFFLNVKRIIKKRAAFCAFVEKILGFQVSYSFGLFVFSYFEVFAVTFSDVFFRGALTFSDLGAKSLLRIPHLA